MLICSEISTKIEYKFSRADDIMDKAKCDNCEFFECTDYYHYTNIMQHEKSYKIRSQDNHHF